VVVERAQVGHMVRVKTLIDGDEFLTYSADGVMVATPTGSTGYNFSAGGPVVDAMLPVMIVTPIAPHFTIDRSIVVAAKRSCSSSLRTSLRSWWLTVHHWRAGNLARPSRFAEARRRCAWWPREVSNSAFACARACERTCLVRSCGVVRARTGCHWRRESGVR